MSVKAKTTLQKFFDYCRENNLPVAMYRMPHDKIIRIVAQKNSTLKTVSPKAPSTVSGFMFSPFVENMTLKTALIKSDIFCEEKKLPTLNFAFPQFQGTDAETLKGLKIEKEKIQKSSTKKEFEDLVSKIKNEIELKHFKKIVAARVLNKKKSANFNVVSLLKSLCKEYPNAFVSLVFTPQYGLWVGATPEVLLQIKNKQLKTYALAGTKSDSKRQWGKKESEEQKLVSDYVVQTFKKISKAPLRIEGPETVSAGNLFHLLTTFTSENFSKADWQKAIKHLHPTPAVAGLPKQKAIDFILKNEKTGRGFYSGYLGPLNLEEETNLFVNIRCMQVLQKNLLLHMGCGITLDSNASDEWKESKAKSEVLLRVIEKLK